MHDIVIRGGTIIDGTGKAAFTGDVAIAGERIAAVGGKPGPAGARSTPTGLLVTPGWVDVHTHYDGQATWDPVLAPSSWHGVTTMLFGNCGVGFAPVRPEHRARADGPDGRRRGHPRHRAGRGADLGVGELSGFSRRAGAPAAHDRRRRPGPAPPAARLCDGRPRHRPEAATPDDIAEMRRLTTRRCAPAPSASPPRAPIRTRRRPATWCRRAMPAAEELLGIGPALGAVGAGAFGMNSDFDDEERGVRLDDPAGQGDRPAGVVPADRPLRGPGALAPADGGVHAARAEGCR